MNWREYYRKMHPHLTEKGFKIGFWDWEERFSIIFSWTEKYFDKNCRILDAGCSIGTSGLILKDNGYTNTFGVDIDPELLKNARNNYLHSVCKMDCEKLSFKDQTFDVVIALNLLEHLKNPEKFLESASRSLKKSGMLIMSVPNTNRIRKLIGKAIIIPEHLNYWSSKSFKKFVENNGFYVIDMKPISRIKLMMLCNTFMVLARKRV